jgi:hypothetical protein
MFNKYSDLYFEMTNKSKKDFQSIDESLYKVSINDKTKKLKENVDIVFYKKSVENFLIAPEKIRIRNNVVLESGKISLMQVIKEKLDKEGIVPSVYEYMHFFCNDIDRHGVFFIAGKTDETIIREIANSLLVGNTELKNKEK